MGKVKIQENVGKWQHPYGLKYSQVMSAFEKAIYPCPHALRMATDALKRWCKG